MSGLHRGSTENRAHTDRSSEDHRLRGRTYAIPFDTVWTQSLRVAKDGMRGWTVTLEDDQRGVVEAEAATLIWRFVDDVRVTVALDENGQTRVDVSSASRVGRTGLGRNPRTIHRFLRRLDRALDVTSAQVLDPTSTQILDPARSPASPEAP